MTKFNGKAEKILKSKLKIKLPKFEKGQKVKVVFPDQEERFGVVISKVDNEYKNAVRPSDSDHFQQPLSKTEDEQNRFSVPILWRRFNITGIP